jgi:hypothetical protein
MQENTSLWVKTPALSILTRLHRGVIMGMNTMLAFMKNPEGYLIHNLEHGYVIFWYNCNLLDDSGCNEIKDQIRNVIDEFNSFKVIGFPRSSIDAPVVATSWGRLQRFDNFDEQLAADFVRANRGRAPEPNAP